MHARKVTIARFRPHQGLLNAQLVHIMINLQHLPKVNACLAQKEVGVHLQLSIQLFVRMELTVQLALHFLTTAVPDSIVQLKLETKSNVQHHSIAQATEKTSIINVEMEHIVLSNQPQSKFVQAALSVPATQLTA